MTTHEREITRTVDLCRPDGRLNPAAVGWTRRPLHRANLRGWGRKKRWEYWGIVSPTHVVGLTLSSLDYAGLHEIYVLDRSTGAELGGDAVVPLARGAVLPQCSGAGTASGHGRDLSITIDQQPDGTSLRAVAPGVEIDLDVPLPHGHESLGVVIPWGPRRFQYTTKDVARPVRGRLRLQGRQFRVPDGESFAVLDHGRGKWPYSTVWNWAAGSAPDRGIQLGGTWTRGTGMTENALLVEGRLHKIGEELRWTYDRADRLRPWRITGERVEVEFHPSHEKVTRSNFGIVAGRIHHCVGTFSGWAVTDAGHHVDLGGLVGWAEEARNRW